MKKYISILLSILILCSLFVVNVYGYTNPEIFRDEITVKVGETESVEFTYGNSSNYVEIIASNLKVDSYISGNKLYVRGISDGIAYITLQFNDGSSATLKVNVGNSNSNIDNDTFEIVKGDYYNLYVDLGAYGANRATITTDDSCISLNKTTFTISDNLKITARTVGNAVIKIKYNTGDIVYYYIDVVRETNNSINQDIYMDIGNSENYYIDLYDYSYANIKYDSDYISINKSHFSDSGNLKITAEKRGYTELKITYDNGDIEYLYINIDSDNYHDSPYVSLSNMKIEIGNSDYFNLYLEDANYADISISNSDLATLSTDFVNKDTRIKVTAKKIGETTVKVVFSDNTKCYISLNIVNSSSKTSTAEISKTKLKLEDTAKLSLYTGSDSSSVTITINNPESLKINLNNYSKYTKSYTINLGKNTSKIYEITALKLINDTEINVKYSNGKTYKFILNVLENISENTNGISKTGKNYILNENIYLDTLVLDSGYISGYTDGTFRPENTITREEFGVMLARILMSNKTLTLSDYPRDVSSGWSKDSIAKLVSLGVVKDNGYYRPTNYITRYEVVEMLYNALDLSEYASTCVLTDVQNNIEGEKISKCFNSGIVMGFPDGTFGGNKNVTRVEAVVMLNRVFYENMYTNKINVFSDLQSNYWGYQYIVKAARN